MMLFLTFRDFYLGCCTVAAQVGDSRAYEYSRILLRG
jgi:hypothetical protein